MVAQGCGLIITISSMGGLRYLFNVPYGVGKAAVCLLLITLCTVLVFNQWQRVNLVLFCFVCFLIFVVWSAGSRYGVWTEKEWGNLCQPVAGGGSDRAGESAYIGWGCNTGWRCPGRLFKLTTLALSLLLIPFSQIKSYCFPQMRDVFINGETTEMSGRCIVHLAKGRILLHQAARRGNYLSKQQLTWCWGRCTVSCKY